MLWFPVSRFSRVLLTHQLPPSLAYMRWACSVVYTLADWPVGKSTWYRATWCLQLVFPVELFSPKREPFSGQSRDLLQNGLSAFPWWVLCPQYLGLPWPGWGHSPDLPLPNPRADTRTGPSGPLEEVLLCPWLLIQKQGRA